MAWGRRDFKDHLLPIPLPWEGMSLMSPTRSGCAGPFPTWFYTSSGIPEGIRASKTSALLTTDETSSIDALWLYIAFLSHLQMVLLYLLLLNNLFRYLSSPKLEISAFSFPFL